MMMTMMKMIIIIILAPVVQMLDSAIHWINHCPLDNSIGFARVYSLDSDLSGGQRYPSFEQLGPGLCVSIIKSSLWILASHEAVFGRA